MDHVWISFRKSFSYVKSVYCNVYCPCQFLECDSELLKTHTGQFHRMDETACHIREFLLKRMYEYDYKSLTSGQQGDSNCGASSQANFILNYFFSNFLSNFLQFPQILSQILHFLPARLAGWNNQSHPGDQEDIAYKFCRMVETLHNTQFGENLQT